MKSATSRSAPIGVLGLQGDFDAHRRAFEEADLPARVVRSPAELEQLSGLVLPGGESTTLIKLMRDMGLIGAISRFHDSGRPIFGTCAGAILMARNVTNPEQFSLGMIDIDIERNSYGRQRESFVTRHGRIRGDLAHAAGADSPAVDDPLELVFIRAPRIVRCGAQVQVLVTHEPPGGLEEPVLVRQGNLLAGTFHPEMGPDRLIHRYFGEMALVAQPRA